MVDRKTLAEIEPWLGELRMPSIRRDYKGVAKEVTAAGGDFLVYLHALLQGEVEDRHARRVERRVKEARFPQLKRLSDLVAEDLPKGITMDLLNTLAAGEYMTEARNIIAVGSSGTGKSHICDGLGLAACEQTRRVRRCTAVELVSELEEAQEQHTLHRYLRRFGTYDLVVIDELGYVPISQHGAELLFQALSERHERRSLVVNTNLSFSEWGQIFKTERLTVALLDRLTSNAQILEMNGESYRRKSDRRRRAAAGEDSE